MFGKKTEVKFELTSDQFGQHLIGLGLFVRSAYAGTKPPRDAYNAFMQNLVDSEHQVEFYGELLSEYLGPQKIFPDLQILKEKEAGVLLGLCYPNIVKHAIADAPSEAQEEIGRNALNFKLVRLECISLNSDVPLFAKNPLVAEYLETVRPRDHFHAYPVLTDEDIPAVIERWRTEFRKAALSAVGDLFHGVPAALFNWAFHFSYLVTDMRIGEAVNLSWGGTVCGDLPDRVKHVD